MDPLLIFIQAWHTVICSIGCFLNGLLIYLCFFKSPKSLKSYATFIINFAITDLIECIFDIFLEYRVVPTPRKFMVFLVYSGVCTLVGQTYCRVGTSIFLHCLPHSLWSLFVSFYYRLYVLTHSALSRSHIIIILLIVYIPSFAQVLLFTTSFSDQKTAQDRALVYIPNYDFTNNTMTSMDGIGNFAALYSLTHICAPIFPVYIAIFIIRRKIIKNLSSVEITSKETRSMHKQLLKCLTFQSIIPVFMLVGSCFYLSCQFGIFNHPVLEYGLFCVFIFMPTLSPVTYLYFVRPFRQFFVKNNKVKDSTTKWASSNVSETTNKLQTRI